MAYDLGVDLGTTFTAAALARDGRTEMLVLGTQSVAVPTQLHLGPDGEVLVGEAARRRAEIDPAGSAREFKRRLGDTTPVLVGASPMSPESLLATVLRWVVGRATEQEGGPPRHTVVTHPANWGPYRRELFQQVLRLADLPDASTITEPEAAAISYASTERVPVGGVVAVYDLGGGTFDAAVLRKTTTGFEIQGTPEGIERLGGLDLDDAVFAHVGRSLPGGFQALDIADDPAGARALLHLRQQCTAAKEALSFDSRATVQVLLPGVQTEIGIDRWTFEQLARPPLDQTIGALRRALTSAGVEPADLHAVVLIGGSSRIPLVAQVLAAELGRPVALDAQPKHAVALGAAIAAQPAPAAAPAAQPAPLRTPVAGPPRQPMPPPVAPAPPPPMATPPAPWVPALPPPLPLPAPSGGWWSRNWWKVLVSFGALVVLGAVLPNPDEDGEETPVVGATTTEPATTEPTDSSRFVPPADVAAGTCFNEPVSDPGVGSGTTARDPEVIGVSVLNCDDPHEYEATGTHQLVGDNSVYPTLDAMAADAAAPCEELFRVHVNASHDASIHGSLPLLFPTATGWAAGGRAVLCVALADDGQPIVGPIAGQGPTRIVASFELDIGDCFNDREGSDVVRLACDAPHDNELIGYHDLSDPPGAPYPGEDAILDAADAPCENVFVARVGRSTADSPLQVSPLFFPTASGWENGNRRVTCVAYADDLSRTLGAAT